MSEDLFYSRRIKLSQCMCAFHESDHAQNAAEALDLISELNSPQLSLEND